MSTSYSVFVTFIQFLSAASALFFVFSNNNKYTLRLFTVYIALSSMQMIFFGYELLGVFGLLLSVVIYFIISAFSKAAQNSFDISEHKIRSKYEITISNSSSIIYGMGIAIGSIYVIKNKGFSFNQVDAGKLKDVGFFVIDQYLFAITIAIVSIFTVILCLGILLRRKQ